MEDGVAPATTCEIDFSVEAVRPTEITDIKARVRKQDTRFRILKLNLIRPSKSVLQPEALGISERVSAQRDYAASGLNFAGEVDRLLWLAKSFVGYAM